MRILFVGALWKGSTGHQRMTALQDLGHEIVELDATIQRKLSLFERAIGRLGYQLDTAGVNAQLLKLCQEQTFDLIWADKTLSIIPGTLQTIKQEAPQIRLLFYSPDDMMISGNQTRSYRACLPLYDLHVTTKSYNVAELKEFGAKDVFFVNKAYDPHTHRPLVLTREEQLKWQADVGFIGGFEQERYKMMYQLAQLGIPVTVRGPGWEPYIGRHPNLAVQPGWVLGDDYARSICATKINLGFLRKIARDLQTARSIEIPACGGFMLAERTVEHLALFVEGQEAEFFGNVDELVQKVKFYLSHDAEREHIAFAGHKRCVNSGYSNHARLTTILEYLAVLSKMSN